MRGDAFFFHETKTKQGKQRKLDRLQSETLSQRHRNAGHFICHRSRPLCFLLSIPRLLFLFFFIPAEIAFGITLEVNQPRKRPAETTREEKTKQKQKKNGGRWKLLGTTCLDDRRREG